MKKLKSLALLSAFSLVVAMGVSSCGTDKVAVAQLKDLNQRIAAVEAQNEDLRHELQNLRNLVKSEEEEAARLERLQRGR